MPLKLYEKEEILEACFHVFVKSGYKKTSTVMLAEAAGISKALLFHHFKSKKNIYFSVLELCFDKMAVDFKEEPIKGFEDFFQAKSQSGLNKINYLRENPDIGKIMYEAYINTPDDIKEDMYQFVVHIKSKHGSYEIKRNQALNEMFNELNLKEGIESTEAYELVGIIDDYYRKKIAKELTDENKLHDDSYWEDLIDKKKRFYDMIRYGIQEKGRK